MLRVIDECGSTNSELGKDAPHGCAVMARRQTAGRGQRGNSWESEAGKNVTLSIMLRPEGLAAVRQFEVSEAVALAVADLVEAQGVSGVRVKWPNDVYVGDRKIAGILIENSLRGALIGRSIAGIGLNVNQTEFVSGAPNPVSLRQLTGREFDPEELAGRLVERVLERVGRDNHAEYRRRLWRGEGVWPWLTADGEEFTAAIIDVLPTGGLILSGRPEPFAFKEVRPLGYAN